MKVLGLVLSADRLDAPLSGHFGKAPWLGVVAEGAPPRFLRNEGMGGGWVAGAFAAAGVTDVLADHMGGGAYGHLAERGLRVWQAAPGGTAAEQVAAFLAGRLSPMAAPAGGHGGHGHGGHGHGGGCGCGGP